MGALIAITGPHGTGKTTAVFETAAKLKKAVYGDVGVVLEVARRCPYPIVSAGAVYSTKQAQMWIFTAQIQAEQDAILRHDWVVSDRTIVDCIAYTAACGHHDLAFAMKEFAKAYVHITYDKIHFRSLHEHDYLVEDGVRSLDRKIRQEMEMALVSLYRDLGVQMAPDFDYLEEKG